MREDKSLESLKKKSRTSFPEISGPVLGSQDSKFSNGTDDLFDAPKKMLSEYDSLKSEFVQKELLKSGHESIFSKKHDIFAVNLVNKFEVRSSLFTNSERSNSVLSQNMKGPSRSQFRHTNNFGRGFKFGEMRSEGGEDIAIFDRAKMSGPGKRQTVDVVEMVRRRKQSGKKRAIYQSLNVHGTLS